MIGRRPIYIRPNHSKVVDALRGFALLGIFVVNIQSYLWGLSGPTLGVLDANSSVWDAAALLFVATIFEYKTYPIFCFCFGYGFAVLARKWRILGVRSAEFFSRRLKFMLILGLLHGTVIWFGDILARYAIAGFVLKRGITNGPRANWNRFKFWISIHIGVSLILILLGVLGALFSPSSYSVDEQSASARAAFLATHTIYLTGDYLTQTGQRISDYLLVMSSALFLIPAMVSLFLLGALTAQCRLLTLAHLPRVKQFWRQVAFTTFAIGVPMSLSFGTLQLQGSRSDDVLLHIITAALGEFGPVLAMGYIAVIALLARPPDQAAPWLYRLFAPAGRVALSFYISQSVLMLIFLNGFFPAITFPFRDSQLGLLGLSMSCYAVLLAVAHMFARYNMQGPLEILWRRYTNHSAVRTVLVPPEDARK